jgi:copper chaperone CopZ
MDEHVKTMMLKVSGIECRGCVEDYEKVIGETDGVVDVSFDFNECIMTVRYHASLIDRKKVYIIVRKLVRKAVILSES